MTTDDIPQRPDVHGLAGAGLAAVAHVAVGALIAVSQTDELSGAGVAWQSVISGLLATPVLLVAGVLLARRPRTRPLGYGVLAGAVLLAIFGFGFGFYTASHVTPEAPGPAAP